MSKDEYKATDKRLLVACVVLFLLFGVMLGYHYWKPYAKPSPDNGNVQAENPPLVTPGNDQQFPFIELKGRLVDHSPNGKKIATISYDRDTQLTTFYIWDAETGRELGKWEKSGYNHFVAVSPDGEKIVMRNGGKDTERETVILDAESGKELRKLAGTQNVESAAFSPDGKRIAALSFDLSAVNITAHLWDAESGKELRKWGRQFPQSFACFSPDSKRIVTTGFSVAANEIRMTVHIWDTASGQELRKWDSGTKWDLGTMKNPLEGMNMVACTFSPDGRKVVASGSDGTVRILDAESGRELRKWDFGKLEVQGPIPSTPVFLIFSPDGRKVVTQRINDPARILDVESGRELSNLGGKLGISGYTTSIVGSPFSPDGKKVVTIGTDNTACIWDAESGRELKKLEDTHHGITTAVFSPVGKKVVTSSSDATRIWDVSSLP